MKVLLAGAGGVGEAIVSIIHRQGAEAAWLTRMIVCDYNLERARKVASIGKDPERFPAEKLDAGNIDAIVELAVKYKADFIMNAVSPQFNMPLFDGAFKAGCGYMDMAMSLSEPHPTEPHSSPHVKLGDLQYAKAKDWENKGLLAVPGSGVEPGMVNVFARYASDHLFDEIYEFNVRDGANLTVKGRDIAFGFSIWTTIEECLNPPIIWEKERGFYTTPPFSEPEIFHLPEGIGPVEMVNVEHEEVIMMPRYFKNRGLKRVTFKYGLDPKFIETLKILRSLGLDRTEKVRVGNVEVSPRDVVAATSEDPATLGDAMEGKTAAGLWVKGKKNGLSRDVYLYQVADNRECMRSTGTQAVVAQTAFNPVIMMELIAKKIWTGKGVQNPEYFPAEPFISRMASLGFAPGMTEMESDFRRARDYESFAAGLIMTDSARAAESSSDSRGL